MRRALIFECEGSSLTATLDEAPGCAGLVVVSGGNEIRVGAHRGMALLAADLATAGHPVLRFDRRGVGDSEGENGGFRNSAPDLLAAVAAFRKACPRMARIVAFGNCDGATALVLHAPPVDVLVLANPWVVEPIDDLPSAPGIKGHYVKRIRDPDAWAALLTGKVDLRAVAKGLGRIALPLRGAQPLVEAFAQGLQGRSAPVTIVLAERDGTAQTFANAWRSPAFALLRGRPNVRTVTLDSASHSFAGDGDFDALKDILLGALASKSLDKAP